VHSVGRPSISSLNVIQLKMPCRLLYGMKIFWQFGVNTFPEIIIVLW
jgi:hypothetical protein